MTAKERSRHRGSAVLLGTALLLCLSSPDVPADDDLARRTFANADQLMREGKVDQALRDFEQIYTAYPDSAVADDALYQVGSHYYPVEKVDSLGTVPESSILKARDLFQKIKTRYPREDSAPRALLKLGWIGLDPSNPQRSLDEAYASFSGVVNIYPGSAEVDRALFGMGYVDFLSGRYDKAIVSFERVADEFATGGTGEDARYHIGLSLMYEGAWVRALEEMQAVRNLYPTGRLAARALDRLALIYKMKVQPGVTGRLLFAPDLSYAPALPPEAARGETALAVDSSSVVHLLDTRTGTVMRLDHEGKLLSSGTPLESAVSVWVDRAGLEIVAAGGKVRCGEEIVAPVRQEGGALRPFERITAAVRVGPKDVAILDEDRNEVLLYTGDPAKLRSIYRDPSGRSRLVGLAAGGSGKLYTIDRRGRHIIEISPDGTSKEIAVQAAASDQELQEPIALAADDIGDLYVLDRRAAMVVVMTVEGKILQRIASQGGTGAEFSAPSSLGLGPRAEIYVHDIKRRTILRFW